MLKYFNKLLSEIQLKIVVSFQNNGCDVYNTRNIISGNNFNDHVFLIYLIDEIKNTTSKK